MTPKTSHSLNLSAVFVLAAIAPTAWSAEAPKRYPLPAECMQPEQGHCYIASMDFGEEGDNDTGNKSMLVLFEDGKPLGPPRSVHADIRKQGQGRFSHWTRAGLYFSASDNSDPRTNGRKYEIASPNPRSTLGGLERFPAEAKQHVEEITSGDHRYTVEMGGTLDMENTRTLTTNNCYIVFQNNVALTIENAGDTPVVNPRLVVNDRGNWYTFDNLVEEFTRGAKSEQDRVYLIWENMRRNLYHETPLFGNSEPHDPVKLFNVYGLNLCDDAGNTGCSLFHHAGFVGSKNRALHGHVQCEAFINGAHQFMDVDMDCFYLDRENEFPVSGNECARDHDLVRRELNYGAVVSAFTSSDAPAALFGPDDTLHDAQLRGHEIAYTLRPGEKAVFRWDNIDKYCAENKQRTHRPKYFGNSKFVYQPRLTLDAIREDALAAPDIVETTAADSGGKLAGSSPDARLDYAIKIPYASCGGTLRAKFVGSESNDRFSIALSLDGKKWKELWTERGAGAHAAEVALDAALDIHNKPAKYAYFVRVGLGSSGSKRGANLSSLEIETDVMAAPVSLPRLKLGTNRAVYRDETEGLRRVRITHQWRESKAVDPLPPIAAPNHPRPRAQINDSIVTFSWPKVAEAGHYHLQVSRRPDFAYPYRTSLDVIIPTTSWKVPYTGIFSPDTTYYWRLRCQDHWGVWGKWSRGWTFTWQGPRVPVGLRAEQKGQTFTLHWKPNPRGERPVRYEVFGSDEKGFSIHKREHTVLGRGKAPSNFLAATADTSMVVASPTADEAAANKVFYRVVAIDANGTESGCSDYGELPHPHVYTSPLLNAKVGRPYTYQAKSLRSLGDYQCKQDPTSNTKLYAYKFWDIEEITFKLTEGPKWLALDEKTGLLSGTPGAADVGTVTVKLEIANQFGAGAGQEFLLSVTQ
jgi:putative Ig domain-containing protein